MSYLDEIKEIPLEEIRISELNVRINDTDTALDELAESIRLHGLLQPVVLAGVFGEPPYELISGQRRFLAHERILGAGTIRAIFAGPLDETEIIIRSLVENLQRVELEFRDTARAVTTLYERMGSEKAVKEATGLSIRTIRDHLLIEARASDKMKEQLHSGVVTPADVKRALQAAQEDISKAERLLDLIVEIKPTSHQKRRIVAYGASQPDANADEILEQAMKPHVERKLVIALSDDVRTALDKATTVREMEASELAELILTEWLENEGFTRQ